MKIRLGLVLCVVAMCACARQTVLLDAPRPTDPPVRSIEVPGLAFEYPGSWTTFANQVQSSGPEGPGGPGPAQTPGTQFVFVGAVGLDELNLVDVRIRAVATPKGEYNPWRVVREFWEGGLATSGARIMAQGDVRVAGLLGAFWEFRLRSPAGYVTGNTLIVLVKGVREYSILCEAIPERATEMARGCQQVLSTLEVG